MLSIGQHIVADPSLHGLVGATCRLALGRTSSVVKSEDYPESPIPLN